MKRIKLTKEQAKNINLFIEADKDALFGMDRATTNARRTHDALWEELRRMFPAQVGRGETLFDFAKLELLIKDED